MSMDAAAWFRSIGIIADKEPSLKGKLIYEEKIRIWPHVKINESLILTYSSISPYAILLNVSIGRYSSIGQNCNVGLSIHPSNRLTTSALTYENIFEAEGEYPLQEFAPQSKRTVVGHDAWIGAGAIVLPGLEIGTGAIVGAGSVITKNIEPYSIYAGNPATLKKYRFEAKTIERLISSEWWRYDLRQAVQRNLIADWADPISAVGKLQELHERGEIKKLDLMGRAVWSENGGFKSSPINQRIFVQCRG